jgi:hypothetical protein
MVELSEFKQKLGKLADDLTDEQIEQLKSDNYKLANILFDMWVERKAGKDTAPKSYYILDDEEYSGGCFRFTYTPRK